MLISKFAKMIDEMRTAVLLIMISAAHCEYHAKIHFTDEMPATLTFRRSLNDTGYVVNKTEITILTTVGYSGDFYPVGPIGTQAMQIALDQIETQLPDLLPNYDIKLQLMDDQCTQHLHVMQTMAAFRESDSVESRFPLILGSHCYGVIDIGAIAHHYNFAGASFFFSDIRPFTQRASYKAFHPVHASMLDWLAALINFIRKNKWRKVGLISEQNGMFNDSDDFLLAEFDRYNISVTGVSKHFSGDEISGPDEEDVGRAVNDTMQNGPRIVILNTDYPIDVACWLSRLGFYGPNFVFFLPSISIFSADDPSKKPWCTEKMLEDILESLFLFGDAARSDIYNYNVSDVTGLTGGELDEILISEIEDPESNSQWAYERYRYYDQVIFFAYWLAEIEKVLETRNETLSDWFTSTDRFKESGEVMLKIMDETYRNIRFDGLQNVYPIDDRSKGFLPIAISQMRRSGPNETFEQVIVEVFKSSGSGELSLFKSGPVVWPSQKGSPPKDAVAIIAVPVPLISYAVSSALYAIAAFQVCAIPVLLMKQFCSKLASKHMKLTITPLNNAMLVGCLAVLLSVFCVPYGVDSNPAFRCTLIYVLIVMGISLIISATVAKLDLAKIIASDIRFGRQHDLTIPSTWARITPLIRGRLAFSIICTIANLIIAVVWLAVESVSSYPDQVNKVDTVHAREDFVIAYFVYNCRINLGSDLVLACNGVIAASFVIILVRAATLIFKLRGKRVQLTDFGSFKIVVYSVALMLFVAALCLITFANSQAGILVSIAVIANTISATLIGAVFVRNLVRQNLPIPQIRSTART